MGIPYVRGVFVRHQLYEERHDVIPGGQQDSEHCKYEGQRPGTLQPIIVRLGHFDVLIHVSALLSCVAFIATQSQKTPSFGCSAERR